MSRLTALGAQGEREFALQRSLRGPAPSRTAIDDFQQTAGVYFCGNAKAT